MGIVRVEKNKNFTIINNEILKNRQISARAKGLWTYIMTLPADWDVSKTEINRHFSEGKTAMATAWKELSAFGYVESHREQDGKGQMVGWVHYVYETAQETTKKSIFPKDGKPDIGSHDVGKPDTTKYLKKLNTNNTKDEPPSASPPDPGNDNFELEPEPEKNAPDKSKQKSSYAQVVDKYFELHEAVQKEKPLFDAAAGKIVKDLLSRQGIERVLVKLEGYYRKEYWFTKNGGRDLKQFRAHYNEVDQVKPVKKYDSIEDELLSQL
jgi:hypothetical protein